MVLAGRLHLADGRYEPILPRVLDSHVYRTLHPALPQSRIVADSVHWSVIKVCGISFLGLYQVQESTFFQASGLSHLHTLFCVYETNLEYWTAENTRRSSSHYPTLLVRLCEAS